MLTHKAMALFMHTLQATLSGPEGLRTCFPTVPRNSECAETAEMNEADSTHPGVPTEPAQPQLTWLPLEVRVVLLEFLLLLVQFLLEVLKLLLVLFLFFF